MWDGNFIKGFFDLEDSGLKRPLVEDGAFQTGHRYLCTFISKLLTMKTL